MTFQWDLIARNWPVLLQGLWVTLAVAAVGLTIAILGGALICAARRSGNAALSGAARAVIAFFRITPEVVLIFWAYFCIPLITGWRVSGFWAGSVTLGLIGAAYLAEIFRGGIETVPKGQNEAAMALGLPPYPRWRQIVLPQALRFSVPPLVNYFTEFLKNTTLLSAIGVSELSLQAYLLGGQTFRYVEFLTAIALVYFALIFPFSLLSRRLELRHAG
jgi:His/Glu/Gln/Arg/opine family amino acid ABC transporter permease subunit